LKKISISEERSVGQQNNIGGAVTVATFNDDVGMDVMTSGVGVGINRIDDEGLIVQD